MEKVKVQKPEESGEFLEIDYDDGYYVGGDDENVPTQSNNEDEPQLLLVSDFWPSDSWLSDFWSSDADGDLAGENMDLEVPDSTPAEVDNPD